MRFPPKPHPVCRRRLRRCTLKGAMLRLGLSLLFFVIAIPLWFILWFAIFVLMVRRGVSFQIGGPLHRTISLLITSGISLFGFLGLFFRHFQMETEVASIGEEPADPLWQIALLPAFLATQGVRNLLRGLTLLTVNHRELAQVMGQIHRSRFYLASLKAQYPLTFFLYKEALLALPGVQLLQPETPYFILSERTREQIFRQDPERPRRGSGGAAGR